MVIRKSHISGRVAIVYIVASGSASSGPLPPAGGGQIGSWLTPLAAMPSRPYSSYWSLLAQLSTLAKKVRPIIPKLD